jgi:hypothetical protein
MMNFRYDERKALSAILYISGKLISFMAMAKAEGIDEGMASHIETVAENQYLLSK